MLPYLDSQKKKKKGPLSYMIDDFQPKFYLWNLLLCETEGELLLLIKYFIFILNDLHLSGID